MKTDMKTRFALVFVMGILPLCWLTPPAWPASCDPEFGPPVPADYSTPLSDAAPPRDLAKTAEVILISGYMVASSPAKSTVTEGKGTIVHVTVDRPGAKVLLVLTSSIWTVHWQVTVTEGTALAGILVSGDKEPVVSTNVSVPAFRVRLPYVKKTESKKFVLLLKELNRLVGVAKVDAIRAGETIPTEITIAGLDAPRPELTLSGPEAEQPASNFTFYLTTSQYRRVPWTLTGPVVNADSKARKLPYADCSLLEFVFGISNIWTLSPDGRTLYTLKNEPKGTTLETDFSMMESERLRIQELESGASMTAAELPPNYPRFFWVDGMAYDSKRDIVGVIGSSREGLYLYRYSAKTGNWLDFRAINTHTFDFGSLSYDPVKDRYIAWAEGRLVFISGEGEYLFTQSVAVELPGYGRLYDAGNSREPVLAVFPHGDELALVAFAGTDEVRFTGMGESIVQAIWYYSVRTGMAILTYKAEP